MDGLTDCNVKASLHLCSSLHRGRLDRTACLSPELSSHRRCTSVRLCGRCCSQFWHLPDSLRRSRVGIMHERTSTIHSADSHPNPRILLPSTRPYLSTAWSESRRPLHSSILSRAVQQDRHPLEAENLLHVYDHAHVRTRSGLSHFWRTVQHGHWKMQSWRALYITDSVQIHCIRPTASVSLLRKPLTLEPE